MNKLTHLKEAKSFLRKITSHRRDLLQNSFGEKPSDSLVIALFDLEYKTGRINNFDSMMKFIGNVQVQQNINRVIPAGNNQWKEELAALIHCGLLLQGKVTSDEQLTMKM